VFFVFGKNTRWRSHEQRLYHPIEPGCSSDVLVWTFNQHQHSD